VADSINGTKGAVTDRENALRIIRFDQPERVVGGLPTYSLCYHGCHHEGFEGGGHDCSLGTKWVDIWGTEWHKELDGVMGFPRGHPLADPENLKHYQWPDQGMPFPQEHIDAFRRAVDEHGRYPLTAPDE